MIWESLIITLCWKLMALILELQISYFDNPKRRILKTVNGKPGSGDFNKSSVVGMLLYLDGHTCPDIAYIVNCAGSYKSCPELVHEHALKQLCYYLNAIDDKGLIMKPYE